MRCAALHKRRIFSRSSGRDNYFQSARINVTLPGTEHGAAKAMIKEAHEICPYSKATRGNIDVAIKLI